MRKWNEKMGDGKGKTYGKEQEKEGGGKRLEGLVGIICSPISY
jgi:hypothetical protein